MLKAIEDDMIFNDAIINDHRNNAEDAMKVRFDLRLLDQTSSHTYSVTAIIIMVLTRTRNCDCLFTSCHNYAGVNKD